MNQDIIKVFSIITRHIGISPKSFTQMGFLYSIIVGGIAGYLASVLMESHHGVIINILLGIVGGFVGGFIARRLGNDPENDGLFMNLLIAVGGAVVLIFIGRLF